MTSRRRVPTTDTGEILSREHSHGITYDKFQEQIQVYTENEEKIISELTTSAKNNLAREAFDQLVLNFKGKDSLIRNGMVEVDEKMNQLRNEISKDTQSLAKSYATELKKLEVKNLEMFKWLLQEELKNEEFRKQEALKKFMAECVNNELAPETPEN